MIAPSPANQPVIAAQPDRVKRQNVVVLTQTIVTPDSTRTAVITLGNGGHPDAGGSVATIAPNSPQSPPPASSGPPKDSGLSPAQIGIILGCCLGAAVLLVVLWFCLSRVRVKREIEVSETLERRTWASTYGSSYFTEDDENDNRRYYDSRPNDPNPAVPRRHGWPSWRSIPPPVVPMYRTRYPPERRWQASARASSTMRPG